MQLGGCDRSPPIVGFLDADPRCTLDPDAPPLLGDPAHYLPRPGDGLFLAIGIPGIRRRVAADLESRGGRFVTFVHPSALVARSARLGAGTLVCPLAVVSDRVVTGRCTLINYHASLGHDSATGAYCVLSPNAALGGHAVLGEDVFLGLSASVGPGRRVGDRSKVAANSVALSDVPPDRLLLGVPGRLAPLLADGAAVSAIP